MTGSADAVASVAPLAALAPLAPLSTEEFIAGIEAAAARFDAATYPQRELPAEDWAVLTEAGVLLPVLPAEYGGRDSHVEMCRVVEVLAERNLALAVYTAVVTGLALRPVVLWAGEEARREVLPLFAGPLAPTAGFASTEPGCGSAMSGLTTTFEEVEGGYRIRGRKHWQALSATASWWLVVARRDGDDGREYGWFVVERGDGFHTSHRYEALGLKVIDYGVNDIDAFVPAHRRIEVGAGNLSSMVDIYLSGRALIGALACGFLRRVAREARAYADARRIGRSPLSAIGFVRYRLEAVDSAHTVCAALNHHVRTRLDLTSDLAPAFASIQAVKIVATELMVSSANHYQQLTGGEGYRSGSPTNIAAQAFLDSRVFTIFDGTNDLLSQQLAQHCLDRAGRADGSGSLDSSGSPDGWDGSDGRGLSAFLADWAPTAPAVSAHGLDLRFLDGELGQEHLVLAGRVIAYTFAAARVLEWAAEPAPTPTAGPARRPRSSRPTSSASAWSSTSWRASGPVTGPTSEPGPAGLSRASHQRVVPIPKTWESWAMPKKRQRPATLAEITAALPPVEYWYGEGIPSPAGRTEFTDDDGRLWRKVRGPLHRNLARRLVTQADELIVGEGAGGHFRHVPPADRLTAWHEIKDRLHADEAPSYHPYEFASMDGLLTLLYIEESC